MTPGPKATISPADSCPPTNGNVLCWAPLYVRCSQVQIAVAWSRTRISPGFGSGTSNSRRAMSLTPAMTPTRIGPVIGRGASRTGDVISAP